MNQAQDALSQAPRCKGQEARPDAISANGTTGALEAFKELTDVGRVILRGTAAVSDL